MVNVRLRTLGPACFELRGMSGCQISGLILDYLGEALETYEICPMITHLDQVMGFWSNLDFGNFGPL